MIWASTAAQASDPVVTTLLAWAPQVALSIGIVVLGVVLSLAAGALVRAVTRRSGIEALAERAGVSRVLYGVGLKRGLAAVLGQTVTVLGLLVTAAALAETVGLPGLADGVQAIVQFVPSLVAAVAIAVAGLLAADFLSRVATRVGKGRPDLIAPNLAGRVIYYGVLAVALATAAQHLGLQTALVNVLIAIVVAAAAGSLALGFALGAHPVLSDIVRRHYAQRLLRPGDHVELPDGTTGVVVRFDALTVTLRAGPRTIIVPCRLLFDGVIAITDPPAEPDSGEPSDPA